MPEGKSLPTDRPSQTLQKLDRNRIVSTALLTLVAILGLGSRRFAGILPLMIASYTGDTAWALAVFLGFVLLFPNVPTSRIALLTLIISYLVEFSQLYHERWIDTIRSHSFGHLALGSGFDPKDLVCYTAGVGIAVLIDQLRLRLSRPRQGVS
jgi:Protein of unknown function (DUF2809)